MAGCFCEPDDPPAVDPISLFESDSDDYTQNNYAGSSNVQEQNASASNLPCASVAASVNTSVNASVAGPKQHKDLVKSHENDMLPNAYAALLNCRGCTKQKKNALSQTCLQKANAVGEGKGMRYATQLAIDDLWNQFNKPPASETGEYFHKGDALLKHMYKNEASSAGSKHKVHWALPSEPHEPICKGCWSRCAGFYDFTQDKPNSTFRTVLSLFNKRIATARNERLNVSTDGSREQSSGNNSGRKALAVQSFLKTWMAEATDLIPDSDNEEDDMRYDSDAPDTHTNIAGSRQRVHVDVNCKGDIYEACIDDMRSELASNGDSTFTEKDHKKPVSSDYFLKILAQHYKVIMHKHKSHSQCRQCLYFRESLKKKLNTVDKIKLKKNRAAHYATVYNSRVTYHTTRRLAQDRPDKVISMIVDGVSKWKTELPRCTRDMHWSSFKPYGNQLYTVLVHQNKQDLENKGGAFNYMVDDAVVGGGNVTAELIWRTLLKLQELRQIWAEDLHVQLDNTSKDNKNHTVFGFLAWLVAEGHFVNATISFLPVGHTHEDIDALFGVVVRYLRKFPITFTHADLIKQVDAALSGCNRTSWAPASPAEVVKGTHNWNDWLNTASSESIADEACPATAEGPMPALRRLENFVMLNKPDAERPHQFNFRRQQLSDGSTVVVMDYKHWVFETENWNIESHVVFNYKPKLGHIKPAKLRLETVQAIKRCQRGGWNCKQKHCPCCSIWPAFNTCDGFNPAVLMEGADVTGARQQWESYFASTNSQAAAESLPSIVHAAAAAGLDCGACVVQVSYSNVRRLCVQRRCRL